MGADTERELPNIVEAEQALLGAILVNNAAYDRVKSFLRPENFYEPIHRRIYMVASELIDMGKLASPVMLKPFLPRDKIGDMTVAEYVSRLAAEAVTIINARDYGRAVHDMWLRREGILAGEKFLNALYDAPPGVDPLGDTEFDEKLIWLRSERVTDERRRGHGQQYLDYLDTQKKLNAIAGVPIFLPELARVICEPTFAPGNLYGIVASSGEGKTSLVLQIVLHAVQQGHPVLIQSFDQDNNQFMAQLTAQQYAIEARRQAMLQISNAELEQIVSFMMSIDQMPLKIVKCSHGQTPLQLVVMAKDFIRRYGNGKTPLVVTDHIRAITPEQQPSSRKGRNEQTDAGTIVAGINQIIKSGAGEHNAAWIMLNQRNSTGTDRPNPHPVPRDVHGGESALYSYDTMVFLYRARKFFEARKAVASNDADWKIINKVFSSGIREGQDIVKMGALKVRFGDMFQEPALLDFEAKYTRYLDKQQAVNDQEDLAIFLASGSR